MIQVGKPAHGLVNAPLPFAVRELAGEGANGSEPSLAVVVRDGGLTVSKSNNIRTTIPRQVREESRVPTDVPPLLDAEIADNELGWLEGPVSVVVRDIDSCLAESDDVSSFVTSQVGNETRVVEIPPMIDPELVEHESDGTKTTVFTVQGDEHPSVAKTNDIDHPVARQVCDEAGVLIDTPLTTRAVAEVVDDGLDGRECSVPIVAADVDVFLAKPYDVWKAISCGVTHEAQVAIGAPTSSVVAEVGERDVAGVEFQAAVVLGNNDSAIPKPDNVAPSDASNVG